jgi:hypothetical protein
MKLRMSLASGTSNAIRKSQIAHGSVVNLILAMENVEQWAIVGDEKRTCGGSLEDLHGH